MSKHAHALAANTTGATTIAELMPDSGGYTVPWRTVHTKIAHYGERAVSEIQAFYTIMAANRWTLSHACQQVSHKGKPIDVSTLSQLLSGKYPSPAGVAASLGAFARQHGRDRLIGNRPHAQTRLSKVIGQLCRTAAEWRKPALIWGKTQEGKTSCLKWFAAEYAATRPVVYFRTPATIPLLSALRELSKTVGSSQKTMEKVRLELAAGITADHILIVDEMHQAFTTWTKGSALNYWEILRNIWDEKQCTLIICGTTELGRQLDEGQYRELLKQLAERSPFHLDTDRMAKLKWGNNKGTLDDINALGTLYGLPPLSLNPRALTAGPAVTDPEAGPTAIRADVDTFAFLRDIIQGHSFGRACDLFTYAVRQLAPNEPLAWQDVLAAHAKLGALSQ